jgi:2-dehydro-3-deoxyphosphogluconate aldolase/(4S)-4-hydroxy-2-oxoglutarate aldolase
VKIFPASQLGGPGFLRAVRSVLPDVPLIPTGGIELDDIDAYLAAGAHAVGMGGQLAGEADAGSPDRLAAVAERARAIAARGR